MSKEEGERLFIPLPSSIQDNCGLAARVYRPPLRNVEKAATTTPMAMARARMLVMIVSPALVPVMSELTIRLTAM